ANTLYITDKVGDGDVSIKGFTGNLHVAGGGSHSVHISDSTIGTLTVAKAQDSGAEPVSIKADSGTTLANVDVQSPVKLEPEASDDTPTITAVTVNTAAASDVVEISTAVSTLTFETSATVALSAPVETVSVSAGADEATVAAVNDAATVGTVKADSTVMDKITLVGNDSLESAAESIVETFTVTATADPNGSVTPAKANVESGGSVTFTFEPDDGYEVDKVTERAATLQSGGVSYTFENVTESHTIHVTFKAKSNNISPLPPSGGGTSSGGSSNTKDTAKAGSVSGAAADTSALPDELKNLKVAFAQVELSSLPGEIQTMVKAGALAFDITATADGADTHDLKGGVVSVSIPFKAPSGVKASKVAAYWLNGGKLEPVNGKFDRATGKMTMKLRHFSTYVIKVNDVKYTATGGWYDTDDLDYAVQRGLLDKFIAGGKLDAGATITRGEFIVAIMKSLGIAPHTEFETTFTDVSGADAAYLNTAKAMGIVSGVNEARTLFEPNRAATRGEQFQIMYNLMTAKLVTLETGNSSKTLADFADGESVPEWLRPALSALLKSGVVRGDGRNLLINGAFTLGQAASVIERMR
ncbi:MAG: S-layer homology domain-containing protein, partial [Oscillospiraceae bacterium]|nr:S-layer homology domain-containing protein [Oscillospiraceae bacterium]